MTADDSAHTPASPSDPPGRQACPAIPGPDTAPWPEMERVPQEHLTLVLGTLGSGKGNRWWPSQPAKEHATSPPATGLGNWIRDRRAEHNAARFTTGQHILITPLYGDDDAPPGGRPATITSITGHHLHATADLGDHGQAMLTFDLADPQLLCSLPPGPDASPYLQHARWVIEPRQAPGPGRGA